MSIVKAAIVLLSSPHMIKPTEECVPCKNLRTQKTFRDTHLSGQLSHPAPSNKRPSVTCRRF